VGFVKQFLKDLKPGDAVDSVFAVKYRHAIRQSQSTGSFFFESGLSDKSGEMKLKYWGGRGKNAVEKVFSSFKEDEVVRVSGYVREYDGELSINVNEKDGLLEKTTEFNYRDFIAETPKNIEEMLSRLQEMVYSVQNPFLKKLLESFFNDAHFMAEFKHAPAAMYYHHAYIGGLLEHSLDVAELCLALQKIHTELDKDLLIAGALLHDVGKIREFKVGGTTIKITEEGMLRGHLVIGEEIVLKKIDAIGGFPYELKIKVAHLLLSHHGSNEFGSPQEPAFPEAIAVYYADECDSKVFQFIDIRATTDSQDFHVYAKRFGRQLYLK
jgi:3'-5' exoribonuclease